MVPCESVHPSAHPMLQWKQDGLPWDEQEGVWDLGWPGVYYTRLDQALILWAIAVAVIFFTAQFHAFDWQQQARFWSLLSLGVLLSSSVRAWTWAVAKNLRWLVFAWAAIILLGLGLTDHGVYNSAVPILLNLCPLWLGLSALGYGVTALGMRSRAMVVMVVLHGVAIALLPLFPAWPFAITGGVLAGSLLLLAQLQWDHL